MDKEKFWDKIEWSKAAGFVVIAYLVVFVWVVGFGRICEFFTAEATGLNEIGDFLAGSFAFPAFVLLVAAVLTQRQELTETRDQFTESQKVIEQQLRNANEQAELLTKQQKQSEESAARAYRLQLFPERYRLYERFEAVCNDITREMKVTGNSLKELERVGEESRFLFSRAIFEYVKRIYDKAHEISGIDFETSRSIDQYGNPGPGTMSQEEYARLTQLRTVLISELSHETSLQERAFMFEDYLKVTDVKDFTA